MAFQYAHILTGVTERAGGQYDQRILAFCLRRDEHKLGNNKRHLFTNKERKNCFSWTKTLLYLHTGGPQHTHKHHNKVLDKTVTKRQREMTIVFQIKKGNKQEKSRGKMQRYKIIFPARKPSFIHIQVVHNTHKQQNIIPVRSSPTESATTTTVPMNGFWLVDFFVLNLYHPMYKKIIIFDFFGKMNTLQFSNEKNDYIFEN